MNDLRGLTEYCRLCLDGKTRIQEGATHVVKSAIPGLKWEVEKDNAKGGSRIQLRHEKSGKLLWTCAADVVPDDALAASMQVLDNIWKDTGVDWTQDEKALTSTPHMRSVAVGTGRRADAAKKPIKHADPDEPILGKHVRFQENVNELDRLQSALRKGEVREDDMENNHG